MKRDYTEQKYIILHNDDGVIHYSGISTGESIVSGLPHYEEYDTEDDWKLRLNDFGISFDENIEEQSTEEE
jgi:hypothetical protein